MTLFIDYLERLQQEKFFICISSIPENVFLGFNVFDYFTHGQISVKQLLFLEKGKRFDQRFKYLLNSFQFKGLFSLKSVLKFIFQTSHIQLIQNGNLGNFLPVSLCNF